MMAAARREELRTHPSPDDLVAYHAQALTPRKSDHVQDHLSFCHDCSQMVMQLAPEIGPGQSYSPLSDQHVSEAWDRFVQELDAPDHGASKSPPAKPESPAGSARPSSLAALAALLIAAVGVSSFSLLIWRSLPAPQGNVELIYLNSIQEPTRSGEPAEEQEAAPATESAVLVLNTLSLDVRYSSYSVTIESDEGGVPKPVWHLDNLHSDPSQMPNVLLPAGSLRPGQYRLRLFGRQGEKRFPLDIFAIQVGALPAQ